MLGWECPGQFIQDEVRSPDLPGRGWRSLDGRGLGSADIMPEDDSAELRVGEAVAYKGLLYEEGLRRRLAQPVPATLEREEED